MASAVSASVQSLEDAASLASELITSLDNLPNEVQHLLNEIRLKDRRCQELQQDIARDQAKYIKHSLRHDLAVSPSPTHINGKFNLMTGEAAKITAQNKPSPKAHLPPRIAASYVEIDALSNEKVALAQRIIDLLTRTRARVDANLADVHVLQGESANVSTPYNTRRPEGMSGSMNSVAQPGEGIRSALTSRPGSADSIPPSPLPATTSWSTYNKKRRLTTTTSIKLQSPAPSTPQAASSTSHPKSRLSRQVHVMRSQQQQQDEEDLDADAEGEEDLEGEDADDDLTPYCFCHKPSFGDMIGCDNPECPYQWFHISCVGVKTPLPDKWYCPECIKNKNAVPERRKGRKK